MQTQEKVTQNIQAFIEELTENSIQHIEADGGCKPVLMFLYEQPDGEFNRAVLEPPITIMDSEVGKEILVSKIIPECKKQISNDGNIIHCVCFITEAWSYTMPKDYQYDSTTNYREVGEKNEKLMMAFHLKDRVVNYAYDMMRIGETLKITNKQVIQNMYSDDLVGRFSRLM